jgi:hypothetical protein
MKSTTILIQFLLVLLLQIFATTITEALPNIQGIVDISKLPPQDEASTLLGRAPLRHELLVRMDAKIAADVLADGSFTFRDVPPGIHEIQVVDAFRYFPKVIVEVNEQGGVKAYNLMFHEKNGMYRQEVVGTITLKPLAYIDYFEKRQQISILSFFMNPMFLIMAFTVGVGWLMPKMLEGLDPEERKEIARQQKDPAKMFQELLGGGSGNSSNGTTGGSNNGSSNKPIENEQEEEEDDEDAD